MNKYFYDDGLLSNRDLESLDWSDKDNPREFQTENGVLHLVEYSFLDHKDIYVYIMRLLFNGKWHCSTNRELFKDEGFSHDNMSAIVCYGLKNDIRFLKKQGWKHLCTQPYYHPRDISFYAWAAGKWWAKYTLWIAALCTLESMLWYHKGASGKLLGWLRIQSAKKESWTFRILDKMFCKYYLSYFESYYSLGGCVDENHPCVIEARRKYK